MYKATLLFQGKILKNDRKALGKLLKGCLFLYTSTQFLFELKRTVKRHVLLLIQNLSARKTYFAYKEDIINIQYNRFTTLTRLFFCPDFTVNTSYFMHCLRT